MHRQNGVFFVHTKAQETKYQQCLDYFYTWVLEKEKREFGVKKIVKQALAPTYTKIEKKFRYPIPNLGF